MAAEVPTVALVAAASNEGAYIAEWIFHHLRMGFSSLCVCVNNSQDTTAEIVARIAAQDERVVLVDTDGVVSSKFRKNRQMAAYELITDLLQLQLGPDDYTMFLDIDEFWIPRNGAKGIGEYLVGVGRPETASFHWFVPDTDDGLFADPFSAVLTGCMDKRVKSAFQNSFRPTLVHPHNVSADRPLRDYIATGEQLTPYRGFSERLPATIGTACVVHRMDRSLTEYVALLGRGRPMQGAPIKFNRAGYRAYRNQPETAMLVLDLGEVWVRDWNADFAAFKARFQLDDLISAGRQAVLDRARRTYETYLALDAEAREKVDKCFSFVPDDFLTRL